MDLNELAGRLEQLTNEAKAAHSRLVCALEAADVGLTELLAKKARAEQAQREKPKEVAPWRVVETKCYASVSSQHGKMLLCSSGGSLDDATFYQELRAGYFLEVTFADGSEREYFMRDGTLCVKPLRNADKVRAVFE